MKHFLTSDPHFGHGNIMKYCARTKWMSEYEKSRFEFYSAFKNEQAPGARVPNPHDFKVLPSTINAMDQDLIGTINKMVGPDDVLWLLGDICFGRGGDFVRIAANYREQINCKTIHVIWGNHDDKLKYARNKSEVDRLFTTTQDTAMIAIAEDGEYWINDGVDRAISGGAVGVYLNHYINAVWPGSHNQPGTLHLYGHTHAAAEEKSEAAMPGRRSMDVGVDNAARLFGEYRPFTWEEIKDMLTAKPGWNGTQPYLFQKPIR